MPLFNWQKVVYFYNNLLFIFRQHTKDGAFVVYIVFSNGNHCLFYYSCYTFENYIIIMLH